MLEHMDDNTIETVDDIIGMITASCLGTIKEVYGNVSYFLDHASTIHKKQKYRGIRVYRNQQNVRIDIAITLFYPFHFKNVCEYIQECIRSEIESMTGIVVSCINVIVESVVM